jgi:hypothetical protein
MEDYLLLTVVVKGENIMRNPLLQATGVAVIKGRIQAIEINTPITSIRNFIAAFNGLLQGEKQ